MKILLITGIPGMGKTTIGNYLEKKHSFRHLDMEKIISSCSCNCWQFLINAILEEKKLKKDIVITWGFEPGTDDKKILELKKLGAKMIWFDGNREAAKKAFLDRGTVSKSAFDRQMNRIKNADIIGTFNPMIFDTFKKDDSFLSKDEIALRLLKKTTLFYQKMK